MDLIGARVGLTGLRGSEYSRYQNVDLTLWQVAASLWHDVMASLACRYSWADWRVQWETQRDGGAPATRSGKVAS